MEIKLKVNIGKMSKWFDNYKLGCDDDVQRDRCEVAHSCDDGAMFVLIMNLLTCDNYSYVFVYTVNWVTLDTVVTLFLFIQRSVHISCLFIYRRVPIFIYLFIYRRVPIFIHLSQIAWNSISESLDYLLVWWNWFSIFILFLFSYIFHVKILFFSCWDVGRIRGGWYSSATWIG